MVLRDISKLGRHLQSGGQFEITAKGLIFRHNNSIHETKKEKKKNVRSSVYDCTVTS
jgi:hypothetical protein